jgi:hypothetical protein
MTDCGRNPDDLSAKAMTTDVGRATCQYCLWEVRNKVPEDATR